MRSFRYLFWAQLKMDVRDRQRLVFLFTMPALVMVLIGLAFGSGRAVAIPVGIVDHAQSDASRRIVQRLRALDELRVVVGRARPEIEALRRGERRLVVVLPQSADAGASSVESAVSVYENERDREGASIVVAALRGAMAGVGDDARLAPAIERRAMRTHRMTYLDFLAPGIIALGILYVGSAPAIAKICRYRDSRLLRRLRVTPMTLSVLLSSTTAVSLVMSLVQLAVIVGLAILVFDVHVVGSIPTLAVVVLAGSTAFAALGTLVASLASSYTSAQVLLSTLNYPMTLLSGVFFETQGLPAYLQPLVNALPLTHLTSSVRDVVAHGASLGAVAPNLAVLGLLSAAMFAAAALLFRWE